MAPLTIGVIVALSLLVFWVGAVKILFVPLSLAFEVRRRWQRRTLLTDTPLVSIIVPGYNEGKVIDACVHSIMAQDYPNFELILVNDGSTDDTGPRMAALAETYTRVLFLNQHNAGKGAALNNGTRYAQGEFLLYVDADGVFGAHTIEEMLRPFADPAVGAVSGDDRPVNLDKALTRLLALIAHVGTGFIRRALAMINCLPVVSGNCGMFRRSALDDLEPINRQWPVRTDTLGEDLELTWRIHRAGHKVSFAPAAVVYAESPATLRGLWRQRVRWARGMLQATVMHKDMIANPSYGPFGIYLLFNLLSMVVVPLAQIIALLGLPLLWLVAPNQIPDDVLGWVGFLGLVLALGILVYSIALNNAWWDLRHLWVFPLWPLYATVVGFTLAWALVLEFRRSEHAWNKLERTGTISVAGLVPPHN